MRHGSAEAWIAAPVDRVLPSQGLRLRHLPGRVQLAERASWAPPVEPTPALAEALERCLDADPSVLTVVKVRSAPASPRDEEACPDCGGAAAAVRIDVALGENLGLVAEELPGTWCWSCSTGKVSDPQTHLLPRLASFDPAEDGPAVPSLLYDTPTHPLSVQMEVTTRCNLSCSYCSHRLLAQTRNQTPADFRTLLDRLDVTRIDNVDFTGLGEPLLNPALPEMVREVRRRGRPRHLRVVTNGTALTRKVFEPLCEAGITSIAVSIDSLDPDTFARARTGARLEQVLANLDELAAYRASRRGTPRVRIKAVLVEDVHAEAERLLLHSAQRGLDMPQLSALDSRAQATPLYREPWLRDVQPYDGDDDHDLAGWAVARWRELTGHAPEPEPAPGLWSSGRAGELLNPLLLPSGLCRWAVDAAFLTLDGESLSCCETMIDLPRVPLGSLHESAMERLWTDDLLWSYRLPLALGRLPAGCVGCPQAPPGSRPLAELSRQPAEGGST